VFAVVDANLEIRYEFGRYPAAMIPSGADPTAIEVTNIDANYVMQADDHIVVWYDLGTSVDKLRIFLMATDVFDGQNSYRVRWSELEGWRSALSHDTSFRVGRTGLHP
jgi:hypothetical protein